MPSTKKFPSVQYLCQLPRDCNTNKVPVLFWNNQSWSVWCKARAKYWQQRWVHAVHWMPTTMCTTVVKRGKCMEQCKQKTFTASASLYYALTQYWWGSLESHLWGTINMPLLFNCLACSCKHSQCSESFCSGQTHLLGETERYMLSKVCHTRPCKHKKQLHPASCVSCMEIHKWNVTHNLLWHHSQKYFREPSACCLFCIFLLFSDYETSFLLLVSHLPSSPKATTKTTTIAFQRLLFLSDKQYSNSEYEHITNWHTAQKNFLLWMGGSGGWCDMGKNPLRQ